MKPLLRAKVFIQVDTSGISSEHEDFEDRQRVVTDEDPWRTRFGQSKKILS